MNNIKLLKSIKVSYFIGMLSVAFLSITISSIINIISEYRQFQSEAEKIRSVYIDKQKKIIKGEVEKALEYINFMKSQTEHRLKKNIKERIHEAIAIAANIYNENVHQKKRIEIEKMIRDALHPIRYNNGRGYYFAPDFNGIAQMFADRLELVGTSLYGMKDTQGKLVVQEIIKIAKTQKEGYLHYQWTKPNEEGKDFPKIAYVKLFEPLGWIFGTGEYLDDVEADIKEEAIQRIAKIRYGDTGYLFVGRFDGVILANDSHPHLVGKNIWELTDSNGVKILQEQREVVENPEGGFHYYTWYKPTTNKPAPKISFVKGLKDWEWIVGTGVHIDEIEKEIAAKRNLLVHEMKQTVVHIILFFVVLMVVIYPLVMFISRRLSRDLNRFSDFFNAAAQKYIKFDPKDIDFIEFKDLITAANHMIEERESTLKLLNHAKQVAEAATQAKSQFLANISHELRTPLNAILGFSRLMERDRELSVEQKANMAIINRSGNHLLGLINEILDISKIEAGVITLNSNTFSLHYFLQGIFDIFNKHAESQGLSFIIDKDPALPEIIKADENKLRQVLINLIGNAFKFTKQGGVTLRIQTSSNGSSYLKQKKAKNESTLYFEVEDTGMGIRSEYITTIFDPFVNAENIGEDASGTGLGLTICRQYVQLMGGYIDVESTPGKGTIFKFNIPIETAGASDLENNNTQPKHQVIGIASGLPPFRVLIVEDNEESRSLLKALLTAVGFETKEARNGKEGIQIFHDWHPDFIWMDMRMPVMDGYEATKHIKSTEKGKKTPIVALTAHAFEEERQTILDTGCDDFVRKPFQESEIFDTMQKHLGIRYEYEEVMSPSISFDQPKESLTPEMLESLPNELLVDLEQASLELNTDQCRALIKKIQQHNKKTASVMNQIIDQFQFDKLFAVVKLKNEM